MTDARPGRPRRPSRWWVWPIFLLPALALPAAAVVAAFADHPQRLRVLGTDAWLITLGRAAGLVAAVMLMGQLALSARIKILDRAFGLDRLVRLHRILGATAGVLACAHPLLLYSTDTYVFGELQWSIWPKMLGVAALVLLGVVVCTSLWRGFLMLPVRAWRTLHQLVFVIVLAVMVHSLRIGSDLKPLWALVPWLALCAAQVALAVWVKCVKPIRLRLRALPVTAVTRLNENVCRIELAMPVGRRFAYRPGQFAFLKIWGHDVAAREHPFTISSSPARVRTVHFTIKASGNFTRTVPRTRVGDTAAVDGPYGRFSYLLRSRPGQALTMIAGGIGVTPMLSMLTHLADTGDPRDVTLIWVNRTDRDILCPDELDDLQRHMPNLRVHLVLDHQEDWDGPTGRLDADMLGRLLDERDRSACVFVCGPPGMMRATAKALRSLGVGRRNIHTERFAL